jgi:hypothetical protein
MFSHKNTCAIFGWVKKISPKKKDKNKYLHDYFLIFIISYFPTDLPT